MLYTEYVKINKSIVHFVGNRTADEGIQFSTSELNLNDSTIRALMKYMLGSFKTDGYYQFWHESDLNFNEIYTYAVEMFNAPDSFLGISKKMAKHLYACSNHTKIRGGEMCVVLFKNIIVDTKTCDAIGIFKAERKDTFFRITNDKGQVTMQTEMGININRLDKGCLIFNVEKESGFWVTAVDNINSGKDAKYWISDFLKIRPRNNSYNQTESLISMTREFISQLPDSMPKIEKINMLNRSACELTRESLNIDEYAENVFQSTEVVEAFKKFDKQLCSEKGIEFVNNLDLSPTAVKHRGVVRDNKVRLDNNFELRILDGENNLEKGYDENKKKYYYKLFFDEER